MGAWLGIKAIIGTALGVVKVADGSQTIQKVIEQVDEAKLTPEERTKYLLRFMEKNDDQNSKRSESRRDLALLWIRYQLSLTTLYLVASALEIKYVGIKLLTDRMWTVSELYWFGTGAVIAFFFGSHIIRQVKK